MPRWSSFARKRCLLVRSPSELFHIFRLQLRALNVLVAFGALFEDYFVLP